MRRLGQARKAGVEHGSHGDKNKYRESKATGGGPPRSGACLGPHGSVVLARVGRLDGEQPAGEVDATP